jgi:hypothetical protein
MNRLKGLACYLSGPIDFAENMGADWRNAITPKLEEMNVKVFDPLKHIFYGTDKLEANKRPKMDLLLEEERFDELREEMKDINHWDLRAIDLSSFIIVNYDVKTFMCGTHEEIFVANKQDKPVLMMIGDNRKNLPKWIYGRFPYDHMFESWEELIEYLDKINSLPHYAFTKADEKRWIFFNGDHMREDESGDVLEEVLEVGKPDASGRIVEEGELSQEVGEVVFEKHALELKETLESESAK